MAPHQGRQLEFRTSSLFFPPLSPTYLGPYSWAWTLPEHQGRLLLTGISTSISAIVTTFAWKGVSYVVHQIFVPSGDHLVSAIRYQYQVIFRNGQSYISAALELISLCSIFWPCNICKATWKAIRPILCCGRKKEKDPKLQCLSPADKSLDNLPDKSRDRFRDVLGQMALMLILAIGNIRRLYNRRHLVCQRCSIQPRLRQLRSPDPLHPGEVWHCHVQRQCDSAAALIQHKSPSRHHLSQGVREILLCC